MNYKTQLNAWALEMIIKAKAAGYSTEHSIESLMSDTKALVDFAYSADSDFNDAIRRVTEYLKSSPDAKDKVEQLMGELAVIQEDILRQEHLYANSNGANEQGAMQ